MCCGANSCHTARLRPYVPPLPLAFLIRTFPTAIHPLGLAAVLRADCRRQRKREACMTRRVLSVVALLTLALGLPISAARADPIRITGGSLEFDNTLGSGHFQGGRVSIVGNRSFSATGIVDSIEVPIEPYATAIRASLPQRFPLTRLSAGPPSRSTARRIPASTAFPRKSSLSLQSRARSNLPPWRDAAVTISAPFEAAGDFHRSFPPSFFFPIRGSGRATLSLTPEHIWWI